ncbi:hypothetical protein, partial [Klebsiella quasipneumoniae]|uniref:hypothetical protein n=1 Tax=Klebsiella quasipneumoniae TaxID=1463165 RepID=UPI001C4735E0
MPPVSSDTVGPRKRSAAGHAFITSHASLLRRHFAGWRYAYPAYGSSNLSLIYSPWLLKLPVLTASK